MIIVGRRGMVRKEPGVLYSESVPGMEKTELILGGCELKGEKKKDSLRFLDKASLVHANLKAEFHSRCIILIYSFPNCQPSVVVNIKNNH